MIQSYNPYFILQLIQIKLYKSYEEQTVPHENITWNP